MPAPAAAPTDLMGEEEILPELGVEAVEACIPRIPDNVALEAIESRTTQFNIQGILKSISENPLCFGAWDQLVNLKVQSLNSEKYEKQKLRAESKFFNTLASHSAANPLADFVKDLNGSSRLERRLIILCQVPQGPCTNRIS